MESGKNPKRSSDMLEENDYYVALGMDESGEKDRKPPNL